MQILILATNIFSSGGIERYTRNLFTALEKIYGTDNLYIGSFLPPKEKEHNLEGKVSFTGKSQGTFGKICFGLKTLTYIKNKKIDMVFCNHVSLSLIAYLAKELFGVRYLVSTHGVEIWGDIRKRDFLGLKNADLILPVSMFTRKILEKKHEISLKEMPLLKHCVDIKKFNPEGKDCHLIEEYNLEDKKVLLSVGRLSSKERYKGHDKVINVMSEIIKKVPKTVYLIVGEGDDRKRLEKLVSKFNLEDYVIFTGFIADDLLAHYYNLCDLFVMPSQFGIRNGKYIGEGFGMVYLEASACAKPIIAGARGGSVEAVIDGKTGILVDPENITEVADSIIKVLTNNKLAKAMGEKGRKRVEEEFSFHSFKNKLENILENNYMI